MVLDNMAYFKLTFSRAIDLKILGLSLVCDRKQPKGSFIVEPLM